MLHHVFLTLASLSPAGPDYKSLLATIALIAVPTAVYFVFVVPYLGVHVSWALVVISILLVVFVFLMLAMTAFRDPGFIPRSPPNTDVEYGLYPSTKDYAVNGYTVTTKYCATCCHYRPPRCSHCAVCDNCVDKFDHHCPWVGTCVGRRNYRTFLFFIISATTLCCWVLATCIVQLWKAAEERNGNWGASIGAYPASLVLIIYVFVAVWFVGGLSFFHMWLVGKNMTTYEHFRHRYSGTGNPYSKGFLNNCVEVWWGRVPPRWTPLWEKQKAEYAMGTLEREAPTHSVGNSVITSRDGVDSRQSVHSVATSMPTYVPSVNDEKDVGHLSFSGLQSPVPESLLVQRSVSNSMMDVELVHGGVGESDGPLPAESNGHVNEATHEDGAIQSPRASKDAR